MTRAMRIDFVEAEVYGIYKAITEVAGEAGWKIMWRSGELAFDQIEPNLSFPSQAPLDVMRTIGNYFVEVGYLGGVELTLKDGGRLEYEMFDASVHTAAAKLIAEDAILPHWSTAIMVAALRKRCGVEAQMEAHDHKPEMLEHGHAKERWILTRDGVPIS